MPIQINGACWARSSAVRRDRGARQGSRSSRGAIGDLNRSTSTIASARPPSGGTSSRRRRSRPPFRDEGADTNALLRELGTDISRVLHGEQEFGDPSPAAPGQSYFCRAKVVDIYEKSGKSGPMAFVVREDGDHDRDNELVATMRAVTVVRL